MSSRIRTPRGVISLWRSAFFLLFEFTRFFPNRIRGLPLIRLIPRKSAPCAFFHDRAFRRHFGFLFPDVAECSCKLFETPVDGAEISTPMEILHPETPVADINEESGSVAAARKSPAEAGVARSGKWRHVLRHGPRGSVR